MGADGPTHPQILEREHYDIDELQGYKLSINKITKRTIHTSWPRKLHQSKTNTPVCTCNIA